MEEYAMIIKSTLAALSLAGFTLASTALADTCPRMNRLERATEELMDEAFATDRQWDRLAPRSFASSEAQDLADITRRLHRRVLERDECFRIRRIYSNTVQE